MNTELNASYEKFRDEIISKRETAIQNEKNNADRGILAQAFEELEKEKNIKIQQANDYFLNEKTRQKEEMYEQITSIVGAEFDKAIEEINSKLGISNEEQI